MIVRSVFLLNFAIFTSSLLFGTAEGQENACSGVSGYVVQSALSGNIKSPGFPDRYPSPSTCAWKITVPAGKQIRLVFSTFEVEDHLSCSYDYLQVRDGGDSTARPIGKFCGKRNPGPLITSGNKAYLHFRSDTSVASKGFELQWSQFSNKTISSITTDAGGMGLTTARHPTPASTWNADTTRQADKVTAGSVQTSSHPVTSKSTTQQKGMVTATTKGSGRPATTTSATRRPGIVTASAGGDGSSRVTSVGSLATTLLTSSTKTWDNFTVNTEEYMENMICYECEGMSSGCITGEGLEDFATECQQNEACWVERIGAEEGGAVYYRRSCQPRCTEYWQDEVCMTADGQAKVCRLCCTEDRCNTHVLTGHSAAQSPGRSHTDTTVASLKLVSILALTVCLDILAIAT
ncbi:hypothetical protein Bbelb_173580 [Branchiostoma belcheri]|nr:hypothetical protein Bbelb_173580 [Branchiostoma belcheri]